MENKKCPACHSEGERILLGKVMLQTVDIPPLDQTELEDCPDCYGTGRIPKREEKANEDRMDR